MAIVLQTESPTVMLRYLLLLLSMTYEIAKQILIHFVNYMKMFQVSVCLL